MNKISTKLKFIILFFFIIFPKILLGNPEKISTEIDWFIIIIGLLGGLALFLYGMEKMSLGLKKTAGNGMRRMINIISKNRFVGLLVGTIVTVFVQSSSATTVMLVSFVNSGLMNFTQTLSMILGANIGTTITTQIIAFNLTKYSIMFVAIGFFTIVFSKNDSLKNIGTTILGFGILFYGMQLMSDSMSPLRTYEPFVNAMKGIDNLFLSVVIGLVFTSIIQSSAAFIGIVIVMASQSFLSLYAGIGMILGANIGTCVTAFLASMNTNRDAKRVAVGHIMFKTIGVLLFIFWIPQFEKIVIYFSDLMNAGTGRQIANAHTLFNVFNAFIMLPFTVIFGKIIMKLIPDSKIDEEYKPKIKHLDYSLVSNPTIAISLARAEIVNSVKLTKRIIQDILIPFFENKIPNDASYKKISLIDAVKIREEKIDYLDKKITEYLTQVSKIGVNSKNANEIFTLITAANYLESIADVVIDDILPLIPQKIELKVNFSEEGKKDLSEYYIKIQKQLSRLENYFSNNDIKKALSIAEKWDKYNKLDSEFRLKHYQRMNNDEHSVLTHRIHMELIDHFQQIGFRIDSIAKLIIKMHKI